MKNEGSLCIRLDPKHTTSECLTVVGTAITEYENAWKAKQSPEVLMHARLRFKFVRFKNDGNLSACYSVRVEKF